MTYLKKINHVPVIYLAGGMKTDWQSQIKKSCPGAIFIDPRESGQAAENDYTAWDLQAVERSDAILGFMEKSNPGGSGLAVEFGWGARGNKHLLLVEEEGFPQERYFGMVRALANRASKAKTSEEALQVAIRMVNEYIKAHATGANP